LAIKEEEEEKKDKNGVGIRTVQLSTNPGLAAPSHQTNDAVPNPS